MNKVIGPNMLNKSFATILLFCVSYTSLGDDLLKSRAKENVVGNIDNFSNGPIVAVEYFLDTDPGEGNGIAITPDDGIFDTLNESFSNIPISTIGLDEGTHTVFIRYQDQTGLWSKPAGQGFDFGCNPLIAAEYFLDTDPGEGNGTPLAPDDGTFDDFNESFSNLLVSADGLDEGPHVLFVRYQDHSGSWSTPVAQNFNLACDPLMAAEYFFDDDPGEGNGTPLTPDDGVFDSVNESFSNITMTSAGLAAGRHTLFIRYQDHSGTWSSPVAQSFTYTCSDFITRTVELKRGWNLVSLPVTPLQGDLATVFQDALIGDVWYWDGERYNTASEPATKIGYWLYVRTDTPISFQSVEDPVKTRTLDPGWHLVGPMDDMPLPITSTISQPLWFWENGNFHVANSLKTTEGYWLYLNESDTVNLGK